MTEDAYEAAIDAARDAYDAAIKPARDAYFAAIQPADDAYEAAVETVREAREDAALSRATAAVLARIEYHGWPDDARHLLAENIARAAVAAYLEGA